MPILTLTLLITNATDTRAYRWLKVSKQFRYAARRKRQTWSRHPNTGTSIVPQKRFRGFSVSEKTVQNPQIPRLIDMLSIIGASYFLLVFVQWQKILLYKRFSESTGCREVTFLLFTWAFYVSLLQYKCFFFFCWNVFHCKRIFSFNFIQKSLEIF